MPTVRAASSAQDPNSRSTMQVGSFPTGWQPGDFGIIIVCNGAAETSYNNSGSLATGWTWISSTGVQNTIFTTFTSNIAYRILQSGDVFPADSLGNGLGWSTSGRYALVCLAIQPDTGQTFSTGDLLNTGTAPSQQGNGGAVTSFSPPSYAAGSNTGLSLILNSARAANNSSTALATTPPGSWTEPANGDVSTASGTNASSRQVSCSVSGRAAQTGTISPGNETISQGGLGVTVNIYHLFVQSPPAGGGGSSAPLDTVGAYNRARLIRASCW